MNYGISIIVTFSIMFGQNRDLLCILIMTPLVIGKRLNTLNPYN